MANQIVPLNDIALDPSTDRFIIKNGDLVLVQKANAVAQFIKQKLRTFFGEWFLDTTIGVPYYQEILKKNPSPITVASILKREIINTDGVIALDSFSINFDAKNRKITVAPSIQSVDGPVQFTDSVKV